MIFRYDKEKEKLIVTKAEPIEYNQCKIWLNRHVKGHRFSPKFKMGVWNGKIDHWHNGQVNLGLWKELFKALTEIGSKFNIENKEDFPINRNITLESVTKFCKDFFKDHKIKKKDKVIDFMPYDYQIETAYKILKNRYCLAEVATSGGKSLIVSIVFFYTLRHIKPDAKFLLILPSLSLVTQIYDNLVEYNTGFQEKGEENQNQNPVDIRLEEIMSDKPRRHSGRDNPNIYIATYQSLAKKENWSDEFFEQFHMVSVDECHQAKNKSLLSILERTFGSAYSRFGVSGTFPSDESCELLTIESVVGPKVTSISAKKLQDKGKITKVQVKQIILNHNDYDFDDKLTIIRKSPNNGAKAYRLEGDYIRESQTRLNFIMKLIKKCDSNTLILFNIIEYGTKLREYAKEVLDLDKFEIHYIDGSVKKKDREIVKEVVENQGGKIKIIFGTYGTLSTGWSVNNLQNIILAESFKSESRIIQSIGRSLRLHKDKDKAYIFDLVDCFREEFQNNAFFRHGKERRDMYNKHEYPYTIMKFLLNP